MATPVEEEGGGARHAPIPPERVQQIFELNRTLDDMVMVFMGLLTKTLEQVPDGIGKVAFMNKLQNAINQKHIEVKGKA